MAHINIDSAANSKLKAIMNAPMTKGPIPRWERKLQEGQKATPLSPCNSEAKKLPCKTPNKGATAAKPSSTNKTPKAKTPSEMTSNDCQADRFIPNRALMDVDKGHYFLMKGDEEADDVEDKLSADFRDKLKENFGQKDEKILKCQIAAPGLAEGTLNNMKVLYSQSRQLQVPKWKGTRHIPTTAEKILDAPGILNDYYLNLLDWGGNNVVAVGLSNSVYLWHGNTGEVTELMQVDDAENITSVKWVQDGNVVAVGLHNGTIELWDTETGKRMRAMGGHEARIGSMAWNAYLLSSGSRTGTIRQHDVRIPRHCVASMQGHEQEVCGLQWSPNGQHLASGGNDNILCIWDAKNCVSGDVTTPLFTLAEHSAAVKAVAWCPWQSNLLASGGGTSDRHIRFWSTVTGKCVQDQDTNSQVCGILWNSEHKELLSGHGFSRNQLTIWKYPAMSQVAELKGHTSRVLCLAMSPDTSMVASVSADETLRIWKCFVSDKRKEKKKVKEESVSSGFLLRQALR